MIDVSNATGKALKALLATNARIATVYVSDKLTVRVTRVRYGGKVQKAPRRCDMRLTVGVPNHSARAFIKKAKRAGEPFPIKKVQLVFAA